MPDGPFHLLLGSLAVKIGEEYARARKEEVERFEKLSDSADADK